MARDDETPTPRASSSQNLSVIPAWQAIAADLARQLGELEMERMRPGPHMAIQSAINARRARQNAEQFGRQFERWEKLRPETRSEVSGDWFRFRAEVKGILERRGDEAPP